MKYRILILLLLVIATLSTSLQAAAMYTLTAIDLGPGFRTGAGRVSESGSVYGSYAVGNENNFSLIRYSTQDGIVDLGPFSGRIAGVNDSGQLASGQFIYTETGGYSSLGDLGGGFTSASAINESGTIVGSSALVGSTDADRAFRWTETGGIENLGTLPGFDRFSSARGINDLGDIVGASTGFGTGNRAVLWSTTGGAVDLGAGLALDINNIGAIIGSLSAGSGGWYLDNGQKTFLPNLSGLLDGFTDPRALNDHGQVVGASTDVGEFSQLFLGGFLWDEDNGLQSLNDLIPENSGWFLGTAFDINNAGQIVGSGFYEGRTVGYLLTPIPEPSVGVLGISAVALFLLRRRRPVS
jgi:probable HAF family extracellular repeat protein